ncbi:hypothetical protein BDZ89DRAFT_228835 [Hymenopellis radicata]|nr:hypothetical protein BDZ89DRAFT_228835 [Hymenopellis radicata]
MTYGSSTRTSWQTSDIHEVAAAMSRSGADHKPPTVASSSVIRFRSVYRCGDAILQLSVGSLFFIS